MGGPSSGVSSHWYSSLSSHGRCSSSSSLWSTCCSSWCAWSWKSSRFPQRSRDVRADQVCDPAESQHVDHRASADWSQQPRASQHHLTNQEAFIRMINEGETGEEAEAGEGD